MQDIDAAFLLPEGRRRPYPSNQSENVYSIEVERALFQPPAVREAAVIGMPSEQWGESVHAVAGVSVTAQALTAHCRARIGGYKAPRSYASRTERGPGATARFGREGG